MSALLDFDIFDVSTLIFSRLLDFDVSTFGLVINDLGLNLKLRLPEAAVLYRNFGVPATVKEIMVFPAHFLVFFVIKEKGNRVLFVTKESYSEGQVTDTGDFVTLANNIFRWGPVSTRIVKGEICLPEENSAYPAVLLAKLFRSLIY
jgi:hypothetical protein